MKRTEKFIFQNVAKKQKTEENNDDVWGDDLEFDEVDKCITIASQLCTQQTYANDNASFISYERFQADAKASSSTQLFTVPAIPASLLSRNKSEKASNSSFVSIGTVINENVSEQEYRRKLMQDVKRLEEQQKKMIEKCEIKDGEISILRTQLKQAHKLAENEKLEKLKRTDSDQREWGERCGTLIKERDKVKCELDLKQLEVMNLKDKMKDLVSHSGMLNESLHFCVEQRAGRSTRRSSSASSILSKKSTTSQTDTCFNRNILVHDNYHPLQRWIPSTFFENHRRERDGLALRHSSLQNGICSPIDHNMYILLITQKNETVMKSEDFLRELDELRKCTAAELDSTQVTLFIDKLILVTRELLVSTLSSLTKVENNLNNEDIRDMNILYMSTEDGIEDEPSLFDRTPWNKYETGIEVRRTLAVVSVVANFNTYLRRSLTNGCNLTVNPSDGSEECDILNLVLKITQIIGKIRRSHQFSGILASFANLLSSLLEENEFTPECYGLIHAIFREIVFSRPDSKARRHVSAVLVNVCRHEKLLSLLCHDSESDALRRSRDRYTFKQNTCTFQIAMILLDRYKNDINIIGDVINSIFCALTTNSSWLYPQGRRCECLLKVYGMTIELLYSLTEISTFTKDDVNTSKTKQATHKLGLIITALLTNRSPELIIRSRKIHSDYFMWIRRIERIEKNLNLESSQVLASEVLASYVCNDDKNEEDKMLVRKEDKEDLIKDIELLKIF